MLPLTPNGKLDRRALPAPDPLRSDQGHVYVAPRNHLEQQIADIWKDVLGLEQVGIHDNFFDLGGHSLLATQVVSRLRTTFNIELPLRSLFERPTVGELSDLIRSQQTTGSDAPDIMPVRRDGQIPLSFAQERLWSFGRVSARQSFL